MFFRTTILGAAFAIAATAVNAFEIKSTELYGGWERADGSGITVNGFTAGINSTAMFSDQFGMDFGLGYGSPDSTFGAIDNMFRISAAGNYYFADGFYAGLFWDGTYFDGFGPFSDWAHVYGVQGGYSSGAIDVTAFYGIGDYSNLGAPTDSDSMGIEGTYTFQNGFDVGAYYLSEDLNGSLDQYGITFGYELSASSFSKLPLYLVGSFGRYSLSGTDLDTFGLALSVPLSGDTKKGRKSFHKRSTFHNVFSTVGTF